MCAEFGPANAADIFYSTRKFDARDALAMGFVSRVLPVAELDREVAAYCATIAENAPLTIAAGKYTIRHLQKDPAARDVAGVERRVAACFDGADYKEGRTSFMEKRTPRFEGK